MPYKNSEKQREFMRKYMREYRERIAMKLELVKPLIESLPEPDSSNYESYRATYKFISDISKIFAEFVKKYKDAMKISSGHAGLPAMVGGS